MVVPVRESSITKGGILALSAISLSNPEPADAAELNDFQNLAITFGPTALNTVDNSPLANPSFSSAYLNEIDSHLSRYGLPTMSAISNDLLGTNAPIQIAHDQVFMRSAMSLALFGGVPSRDFAAGLSSHLGYNPGIKQFSKIGLDDGVLLPLSINGKLLRDLHLSDLTFRGRPLPNFSSAESVFTQIKIGDAPLTARSVEVNGRALGEAGLDNLLVNGVPVRDWNPQALLIMTAIAIDSGEVPQLHVNTAAFYNSPNTTVKINGIDLEKIRPEQIAVLDVPVSELRVEDLEVVGVPISQSIISGQFTLMIEPTPLGNMAIADSPGDEFRIGCNQAFYPSGDTVSCTAEISPRNSIFGLSLSTDAHEFGTVTTDRRNLLDPKGALTVQIHPIIDLLPRLDSNGIPRDFRLALVPFSPGIAVGHDTGRVRADLKLSAFEFQSNIVLDFPTESVSFVDLAAVCMSTDRTGRLRGSSTPTLLACVKYTVRFDELSEAFSSSEGKIGISLRSQLPVKGGPTLQLDLMDIRQFGDSIPFFGRASMSWQF